AVALAFFSHDPADPPAPTVYPAHSSATNLLGPGGAWIAGALHQTLGLAAYILLPCWFVLVIVLFLRRDILTWSLRLAGWLVLLPCAALTADWLGPVLSGGPVIGGGGSLGAWLSEVLAALFPLAVQWLIYAAGLLLGLLLALDFLVVRFWSVSYRAPLWLVRQ